MAGSVELRRGFAVSGLPPGQCARPRSVLRRFSEHFFKRGCFKHGIRPFIEFLHGCATDPFPKSGRHASESTLQLSVQNRSSALGFALDTALGFALGPALAEIGFGEFSHGLPSFRFPRRFQLGAVGVEPGEDIPAGLRCELPCASARTGCDRPSPVTVRPP